MARKKPHEEHENHERWLVSYADFITLLFAFFVVMYAVSSVNEGKYRVLSEALVSAFRSSTKSLQPIQIGQNVKSPAAATPHPRQSPMAIRTPAMFIPNKRHEGLGRGPGQRRREEELARIGRQVAGMLKNLVDQDLVKIHRHRNWVEVEIKDRFLFKQGGAELQDEARKLLVRLATLLRKIGNPLRVEGHTDDQPVRSSRYPTNWDLSVARATSVVKLFEKERVSPWQMSAAGYGEYRPVASNARPEGRASNRRVTLVILASQSAEQDYELEQGRQAEKRASEHARPRVGGKVEDMAQSGPAGVLQESAKPEVAVTAGGETGQAQSVVVAEDAAADVHGDKGVESTAVTDGTPAATPPRHAAPRLPPVGSVSVIDPPIRLPPPIVLPMPN